MTALSGLQALILSERLHAVGSAFDRCRSLRYQQLLQQQRRRRALPEALVRAVEPSNMPSTTVCASSSSCSGSAGGERCQKRLCASPMKRLLYTAPQRDCISCLHCKLFQELRCLAAHQHSQVRFLKSLCVLLHVL